MTEASDYLKEELVSIPNDIRDTELEIIRLTNNVNTFKNKLKQLQSNIMRKITQEIYEDTGKPAYTNDTQRDAELSVRLSGNKLKIEYEDKLKIDKENLGRQEVKLNFLKNRFKSIGYLVKIFLWEGEK